MIQLKVNGKALSYEGDPPMPLLWYLRDSLQLAGSKFGCGMRWFDEAPFKTHIDVVKNDYALPTSVGEPGVLPMSPAIYHAVFAGTGKRFRELPPKKQQLV